MVVLIWGDNEHAISRRARELTQQLQKRYPESALFVIDGQEDDAKEKLYEHIVSRSIFGAQRRIITVKNVYTITDEEELEKNLSCARDAQEVMLIIASRTTKSQEMSPVGKILKEYAYKTERHMPYDRKTIIEYIKKRAQDKNMHIDNTSVTRVCDTCGAQKIGSRVIGYDMSAVENEIDRLALLGKNITEKELDQLYEYKKTATSGELVRAIQQRHKETVLAIGERIMYTRIEPAAVLNYIAKAIQSPEHTKKLLEIDRKLKSGLLDPDQALLSFILL